VDPAVLSTIDQLLRNADMRADLLGADGPDPGDRQILTAKIRDGLRAMVGTGSGTAPSPRAEVAT
jgi:hypothetical protein